MSEPALVARYDALASEILDTRKGEVRVIQELLSATYRQAEAAYGRAREAARGLDPARSRQAIEDLATLVGYLGTEGDASVARVRKRLVEGGHHFNPILTGAAGSPQAPGAHHVPGAPGPKGHQGHQGASKEAHAAPGTGAPAAGQPPPGSGHHVAGTPGHQGAGTPGHHGAQEAHHHGETGHHGEGASLIGYDAGYVVVNRAAKKALVDASRALARLAGSPSPEALETEWKKVAATCAGLGIPGR